jgi:hypothetical protein
MAASLHGQDAGQKITGGFKLQFKLDFPISDIKLLAL